MEEVIRQWTREIRNVDSFSLLLSVSLPSVELEVVEKVDVEENELLLDGGFVVPETNSFGQTFRYSSSSSSSLPLLIVRFKHELIECVLWFSHGREEVGYWSWIWISSEELWIWNKIKRTSGFYAICIHRTFPGEIRVDVVGSCSGWR